MSGGGGIERREVDGKEGREIEREVDDTWKEDMRDGEARRWEGGMKKSRGNGE
jgi:hypothetical protein